MAKKRKREYRKSFNSAPGKNSNTFKRNEKAAPIRKQNKIKLYALANDRKYPAYHLVTRCCVLNGKPATKISVRRTPIMKDKHTKLLRLGNSGLKFAMTTVKMDFSGYRIMNLENLKDHVAEISLHVTLCERARDIAAKGETPLSLTTETKKNGLSSVLWAICHGCNQQFGCSTSLQQSTSKTADINLRAVWGSMSTGGGASSLSEILGTMSCPTIQPKMFSKIEQQIGVWWEEMLKDEMMRAGAEEKRLAIERGDTCDGVPAVTVVCDGGWSKRAHKHSYNATGGVAIIIGAETKKLLYIGVRNKFCYICNRAKTNNVEPVAHTCFKNWTESSQSMEADILVQGFLEAECTHGVRYMRIVADGDSSVYAKIQETIPVWGNRVVKIECANHACKCLRSSLEKLVQEKPHYKGKGKLTKLIRVRLTTAVRCAIRMRSKENNSKQLAADIRNSVHHVFGLHDKCSNFCKKRKKKTIDTNETEENENEDEVDEMFENQSEFWNFGTDKDMEESRDRAAPSGENVGEIIRDVLVLLNRLALKSERLIGNFTTNLAESWMSIRSKFDGAKVINRCNRGSWHARCFGGALRKNLGPAWSPIAFHKATGTKPGTSFCNTFRQKAGHLARSLKSQNKPDVAERRRKRKRNMTSETTSKKAKRDYGHVLDDSDDVSGEKLKKISDNFVMKVVNKTLPEIAQIETNTRDQSKCELWFKERKIRLTSSNFGKVMARRESNTSTKLVQSLLYCNFKGNIRTIRGLAEEDNTILEYKAQKADVVAVTKVGLVVSDENPFLATSTDGKVVEKSGSEGLIEIKNLLQTNKHMLKQAVKKVPNFCLQTTNDGSLSLKKTHAYYYQCQGQLNIMNLEWLDFVVRRCNPYDIHIERIYKNNVLWRNTMLPKLRAFYHQFMLPELSLPRHGTVTGIREPQSPWFVSSSPQPSVTATGSAQPSSDTRRPHPSTDPRSPQPSTDTRSPQPSTSATFDAHSATTVKCRQRKRVPKFVGRRISHEWLLDENTGETAWYDGTVLDVSAGSRDGTVNAEYEVLYDGDTDHHIVDHLHEDFIKGSLKFIDL